MTLVELLVVIGIAGILAAAFLPAVSRVKVKAQVQTARVEMDDIVSAVAEYEALYSRYPVSDQALKAAGAQNEDLTFGGVIEETHRWVAGPGPYLTNNCEVMAVLLDLEQYGDGATTINQGHCRNPGQNRFLHANTRGGTNAAPGVGVDGIYRDPWGSPYIITLDLNRDGRARDILYRNSAVSQDPQDPGRSLKGLVKLVDPAGNTFFEATTPVLVWSAGPDRRLDMNAKADRGANRDNVLSWNR